MTAIGFAWAVEGVRLSTRALAAGGLWGVLMVLVIVALPLSPAKLLAILKLPLLIACGLAMVWMLGRRSERWQRECR